MRVALNRGFGKRLARRIEKYEFEVGILNDKAHKLAKETPFGETPDLGVYAGGPVRKLSGEALGISVGDVLVDNMQRMNTDLLREPFQKTSSDINKFTKGFLNFAFGRVSKRRVENLLQAIVRNPILRGDYGGNSAFTADVKGFDRFLIDTGQMFKNIKARLLGSAK